MSVTYRFQLVADRSDGTQVVIQDSAAVYATAEEALMQAGADAALGANPVPVDIIDGAHHGYDQPASEVEGDVIADGKVIAKAEAVMRELWIDDSNGSPGLMPFDRHVARVPIPDDGKRRPKTIAPGTWDALREHEATTAATIERMKALL